MARPTSTRLRRARRREELDLRDTVLKVADKGLQDVEQALARAAVAATCRPQDAAERIAEAQLAVRFTRRLLVCLLRHRGIQCPAGSTISSNGAGYVRSTAHAAPLRDVLGARDHEAGDRRRPHHPAR